MINIVCCFDDVHRNTIQEFPSGKGSGCDRRGAIDVSIIGFNFVVFAWLSQTSCTFGCMIVSISMFIVCVIHSFSQL